MERARKFPAGKSGVRIKAPQADQLRPSIINNVMEVTENDTFPCRIDVRFKFKVPQRQKVRILELLRNAFTCILTVGFVSNYDLKIVIKRNEHGCPRYEIKNYIQNGFQ